MKSNGKKRGCVRSSSRSESECIDALRSHFEPLSGFASCHASHIFRH